MSSMSSHILAIMLSMAFASAATPSTADCQDYSLNVYQQPNASMSYSIPAVVSTSSTMMNSTTKTWQIINGIGIVPDPSNVVDPQAQLLSQQIILDTSSTINGSSASPSPLAGCTFTFAIPSSYIGKTSSDGSCGKIFGQSCLKELNQIAQDTTAAIPPAVGFTQAIDACDTVTNTLNNYIATSSKGCNKHGPSIYSTQGK